MRDVRRHPVKAIVLALAITAPTLLTASAGACPMCSESLPDGSVKSDGMGDNPQTVASPPNLAEGFYYSIVFMLAVPFSLMTAVGVAAYVAHRKGGWNRAGIPAPANASPPAATA